MNESIMREMGFNVEMDRVEEKKCAFCGKVVDENGFRNNVSKREYSISGLCQACQDLTFGSE